MALLNELLAGCQQGSIKFDRTPDLLRICVPVDAVAAQLLGLGEGLNCGRAEVDCPIFSETETAIDGELGG